MTTDAETDMWVLPKTSHLVVALAVPALISAALAAIELAQLPDTPTPVVMTECASAPEAGRAAGTKRIEVIDRPAAYAGCVPGSADDR